MGKSHLLLVDDEPVILHNMSYIFREYGFEVETATKVQTALDILNSKVFDIIITDERLPDMSGAKLIAMAHKLNPKIHAFIHTGAHDFELSDELRASGITRDHILFKPIPSIRELAEKLKRQFNPTQ